MKIAGGVLAILAGLVALAMFGSTLYFWDEEFAQQTGSGHLISLFSWLGVAFSTGSIALGVAVLFARSKLPAGLLVVCAGVGALLAGLGTKFLFVAAVGGVIALFGKYGPSEGTETADASPHP